MGLLLCAPVDPHTRDNRRFVLRAKRAACKSVCVCAPLDPNTNLANALMVTLLVIARNSRPLYNVGSRRRRSIGLPSDVRVCSPVLTHC